MPVPADGIRSPEFPARLPGQRPYPGTASPCGSAPAGAGCGSQPGSCGGCLRALAAGFRDMVREREAIWHGLAGSPRNDAAVLSLAATLRDLRDMTGMLSDSFRARAASLGDPAAFERAASVHAAARFAGQAWLILAGTGPAARPGPAPRPGAPCPQCQTTPYAAARPQAACGPGEDTARILAGAMTGLSGGAARLAQRSAGPLARALTAVQVSLATGARHLDGGRRPCQDA